MIERDDMPPDANAPPLNGGEFGRPTRRFGAAAADTVPMIDTFRVTEPDLHRRAAMERTRGRLVIASAVFTMLFVVLAGRLAWVTVVNPKQPRLAARPVAALVAAAPKTTTYTPPGQRAVITDRNGQNLAISLPSVAIVGDPRVILDPVAVAHSLKQALPRLDEDATVRRLSEQNKQVVYLERQVTPREEAAIRRLNLPGIDFRSTQQRNYPMGRAAAQVLGGVGLDEEPLAGLEKGLNTRILGDQAPLRLSLDVRVQAVVRDELLSAMDMFSAIGAAGMVMDVSTGEMLAIVSLPDYDANNYRAATDDQRMNRATKGLYEPGSTFKLQTAAMALDSGLVHIWDQFDASHPIQISRFTITDFEGKHRWLFLPEVLAYSSNLGAAHIAQLVGAERQRNWLRAMGMFDTTGLELPEVSRPLLPRPGNWKEIATMTIGFGHGVSVTPLHVVRATAAVANGGVLVRPTLLAVQPGEVPAGERVMQQGTSDLMRKLMRLVVTDGFGKSAEVAGYYPGGKTGTAEKVGHGGYRKHANVAAFMCVFPMNAPRYAVYMMLDEPHATKATFGYATAGWVAAPAAGRVIARIGPMLGLMPDTQDKTAIDHELAIPLQPGHPQGMPVRGPGSSAAVLDVQTHTPPHPPLTVPPALLPPAMTQPPHPSQNRRAEVPTAPLVSARTASPVAVR